MSLRKSPRLTPALLAACRSNARKGTGPRTPEGKARVALNGLRHGRHARVLPYILPRGLRFDDRMLYRWILRAVRCCFRPETPAQVRKVQRAAFAVWCQMREQPPRKGVVTGNVTENTSAYKKLYRPQNWYRMVRGDHGGMLTFLSHESGRIRRPRVGEEAGEAPPRSRALKALWRGAEKVEDWAPEPVPDPKQDPMAYYQWSREMRRQRRARRRAEVKAAAWRERERGMFERIRDLGREEWRAGLLTAWQNVRQPEAAANSSRRKAASAGEGAASTLSPGDSRDSRSRALMNLRGVG